MYWENFSSTETISPKMTEADCQDLILEESLVKSFKVLSLSELPPHDEPDNKNPPKIDLKSEIDLDPHAITAQETVMI